LSIRFQADNDLKRIIVDATLRREPRIDFQTGSQSRILVSHDKRTMPAALASLVASGVIPQNAPIRDVVETLFLIWADDRANDWKNLIAKIPFGSPPR
jgi:hypothetical protein